MTEANAQQVQQFIDVIIRPRAEQFRAINAAAADDLTRIPDVFNFAADNGTSFTDSRSDVAHQATKQDVLSFNSIIALFEKFVGGTATLSDSQNFAANWPTLLQLCVRPIGV